MAKKDDLIKDIDELELDSDDTDKELDDFDDVSDVELKEIEELIDNKKAKKTKKTKKSKEIAFDDFDEDDEFEEISEPKKESKKEIKESKKMLKKEILKNSKKEKVKKTSKKLSKEMGDDSDAKESSDKGIFGFIVLIVVVAVVLAIGFNSGWFNNSPATTSDNGNTTTSTNENVAAYVNSVPITTDYLNTVYDQLSAASYVPVTKEQALENIITEELIKQNAEELGIIISTAEAEEKINSMLAEQGMTLEQLDENLESSGTTFEQMLEYVKYSMIFSEVADETFKKDLEVSNSDLANYFVGKVAVRHILIMSAEENETVLERLQGLKSVLEEDDSEFCDIASSISEDTGSKFNCGKYVFGAGEMVKEFEDASFALAEGDLDIVKTQYGYHLIQRVDIGEDDYADAEEQILTQKTSDEYLVFVEDLEANADIEIVDISAETISTETDVDSGMETDMGTDVDSNVELINDTETGAETDTDVETGVNDSETGAGAETDADDDAEYIESNVEEETTEPIELVTVQYYYSETDDNSQTLNDLMMELEDYDSINVEWRCISVTEEDADICIDMYGEADYMSAMNEANNLGLTYAPSLIINAEEYTGSYKSSEVRTYICDIAGC